VASKRICECWHDEKWPKKRCCYKRNTRHLQLWGIEAEGAHVALGDHSRWYQALHEFNCFRLVDDGHLQRVNRKQISLAQNMYTHV
jgi:hypothetical protein